MPIRDSSEDVSSSIAPSFVIYFLFDVCRSNCPPGISTSSLSEQSLFDSFSAPAVSSSAISFIVVSKVNVSPPTSPSSKRVRFRHSPLSPDSPHVFVWSLSRPPPPSIAALREGLDFPHDFRIQFRVTHFPDYSLRSWELVLRRPLRHRWGDSITHERRRPPFPGRTGQLSEVDEHESPTDQGGGNRHPLSTRRSRRKS